MSWAEVGAGVGHHQRWEEHWGFVAVSSVLIVMLALEDLSGLWLPLQALTTCSSAIDASTENFAGQRQ